MSRPRNPRRAAEQRGRGAELLCLWQLRLKGYRILARRYKTPVGEIDLIARRGRVLAAIEVKARADLDLAGEAITPRQRHRISRAFAHFLGGRPDLGCAGRAFRRHAGRAAALATPPRRRLA
jgi:putative endonuclease